MYSLAASERSCHMHSFTPSWRTIVCVSDDLRLPMELTARLCRVPSCPGWEVSSDELFESVQGDVRQQRRQDATLRRSGSRFGKYAVVEPPGLEPRFDKPVQGRE